MKKNKNLSRNDRKNRNAKTSFYNLVATRLSQQTTPTHKNPRFTFKELAVFAYNDIEQAAKQCGLSASLVLKIIQSHPLPKNLHAGIVDTFPIVDHEATIHIDVAIIANESSETFPIIGFSMDGKKSVFNGHKWFLTHEHRFLELLNDQRKINTMTESLSINPIVLNQVGGV
jgi:hypothetical protein